MSVLLKNLKDKEQKIKKIGMDYKKIKFLERNSLMICEDEGDYFSPKKNMTYYTDLRGKIDYILLQMDETLSKFVFNEYFSNKTDNWWIYQYSKSTYYRIKHKAIDSFLEWWYA